MKFCKIILFISFAISFTNYADADQGKNCESGKKKLVVEADTPEKNEQPPPVWPYSGLPPLAWPPKGFYLQHDNFYMMIFGQLNQDVIYVNDGARSRIFYGDNDVSASTLRFTTTTRVPDCLDFFSIIELGIQDQSSREVSQLNPLPGNRFNLRIGEAGINSYCLGRLSLGQGYTATDYTAEVDLSGVDVVLTSAVQKMGGAVIFSDESNGSLGDNPAIQNAFDNLDGLNRRTRLRYDTPEWKGWTLSGSVVERSNADIALRYHKELHLFKFAGAIGYASSSVVHDNVPGRNLDGSASILFCNGLNFTIAKGEVFANERGRKNPRYIYGKIGYQADLFCIGKTNFAADMGTYSDYNTNDEKGREYGVAIVQNFTKWNSNIYIAARHFTLNHSSEPFNPINLAVAGIRVGF